jgi:hypothetical protein
VEAVSAIWSGKSGEAPQEIADADLTGLNPEAIVVYPGLSVRIWLTRLRARSSGAGGSTCRAL